MDVGAAGDRHELLRVAPHAVLADVEAVELVTLGDAQADRLLDQPEEEKEPTKTVVKLMLTAIAWAPSWLSLWV